MITHHNPPTIYPPAGPYAHGVELRDASRLLYISGTMGLTPDGSAPDSFEAQCEQAWANIGAVLDSAGMTVRSRVLGTHRVAVTVVAVTLLESAWKLEIEAVAAD
jgi:enamine deaminase RidA (YjgF/YER057c/UK114 family)